MVFEIQALVFIYLFLTACDKSAMTYLEQSRFLSLEML
jgi:hypothetical protein